MEPYWRATSTQPKRPLYTIILDEGVKQMLLDDARHFLDSRPWYCSRGIPFRRGYLLVRDAVFRIALSSVDSLCSTGHPDREKPLLYSAWPGSLALISISYLSPNPD